ncbi:MAG: hypothetical protein KDD43_06105, partial [Bdellovibrionales bacterium]|nr:hypothetical protein [Bdellovibrionales bacterium]
MVNSTHRKQEDQGEGKNGQRNKPPPTSPSTIMVTGSHIPDDRNGIKFNLSDGEILKHDE